MTTPRICVFTAGEPPEIGEMCVETARYYHPESRICHITDYKTRQLSGTDEVWRAPWDGDHDSVLAVRLRQLAEMGDEPTVLLDSDILVCGELGEVFEQPFDVALTWRNKPKQPYNMGVMFSRKGDFWRALWERFSTVPVQKAWFEEQTMLREEVETGRWEVLTLPCEIWNSSDIGGDVSPAVKVRHYKGGLKTFMPKDFWRNAWKRQLEAA